MDLIKANAWDWVKIVLESQIRKRRELARLGRCHLSPFEQRKLGLSDTDTAVLDAHAHEVYDLLEKKGIPVPFALHPGMDSSIHRIMGEFVDYHYRLQFEANHITPTSAPSIENTRGSILLIEVAQHLFDSGFTDIDKDTLLDAQGNENLQEMVQTSLHRATGNFPGVTGLPLCVWLLQKDSNSYFTAPPHADDRDTPSRHGSRVLFDSRSLLMDIASLCGTQPDSHWSLIRLLAQYVSGLTPPVPADSCVCYCLTTDGCLPQHLHASLPPRPVICNGHEHRGNALLSWIDSCVMTNDEKSLCFEQAVRLELFDRLGLVHTCCQTLRTTTGPPTPEEVEHIREDDHELASQLELLMLAYRGSLLMFLRGRFQDGKYSTEFNCGCNEHEGLGKRPPSWGSHNLDDHTTRLLAHWRHWWTVTDCILADIYAITAYDEKPEASWPDLTGLSEYPIKVRDKADTRTVLSLEALGFGDLHYQEVIERHLSHELAYARDVTHHHVPGEDENYYWDKRYDEASFVPVYRTELLDELMERLRRAVSGEDEIWTRETERWNSSSWWDLNY